MKPSIRDLIPALVVFLFVACLLALLMELLIPALAGRAADSGAITALSTVLTACVSGLILLYLRDTAPRPPEREEEPEPPAIDDSTMERAHDVLGKYLDQMREWPRWKPRSA